MLLQVMTTGIDAISVTQIFLPLSYLKDIQSELQLFFLSLYTYIANILILSK